MISPEAKREYDQKRLSQPGVRERKNRLERERSKRLYAVSVEFRAKKAEATKKNRLNMSDEKKAEVRDRERARARQRRLTVEGRMSEMLVTARGRAKKLGLDFDIDTSDVQIPEQCPVLGVPLVLSGGPNSPSLDRVDNRLGYVKGNVRVISDRANRLKKDGTAEEHEAIARFIREHLTR